MMPKQSSQATVHGGPGLLVHAGPTQDHIHGSKTKAPHCGGGGGGHSWVYLAYNTGAALPVLLAATAWQHGAVATVT